MLWVLIGLVVGAVWMVMGLVGWGLFYNDFYSSDGPLSDTFKLLIVLAAVATGPIALSFSCYVMRIQRNWGLRFW